MLASTVQPTRDAASQPEVVILDDDRDMLESVRDIVRFRSRIDCLTATSCAALQEFGERALACRVAILDINLGADQPSGIDAYDWLRRKKYRGRIAFLTGHARTHPLVQEASRLGRVEIIEKPATVDTLLKFIGT